MTPLIYNLFPRLVGPMTRWPEHSARAAAMNFNWLFLNPWHAPGFSGSLYAPKEFRRINPLFIPPDADPSDLSILARALSAIEDTGLRPMMDLVVNHTSKDSPLTSQHPGWYVRDHQGTLVSPSVRDPDDPSRVTTWGDLAEIDNARAHDREELWRFWADLVRDSIALGFRGFRCDAAYMVPSELWRYLIDGAKGIDPSVTFFAETLGAPLEKVLSLRDAGFDFIFNSTKWWNFYEPWAIEQHEQFREIAPSISFPESHDTARLTAESGGSEAVQRQRYALSAAFSAGLMMPIGYEFGFRRQLDVVRTMPADWERKSFDLTRFAQRVNGMKLRSPALQGEGAISLPWGLEGPVLLLERRVPSGIGWILMNKETDRAHTVYLQQSMRANTRSYRVCDDEAELTGDAVPEWFPLGPAEVVYILPD